jgi:phosphoglycolate phosphatase-like HAD superfamily hydrolase
MTIKCFIFDIDGTLSDPTHRLHHVQWGKKEWDQFFSKMGDDAVREPIADLCNLCGTLYPVLIVTGRPENYRDETTNWLERHDISCSHLYMRPANDTRPDHIVKKEILDKIRAEGYDPVMVFDDRQSVVDMWRANGLICAQVAPSERPDPLFPVPENPELLFLMVGPTGAGKTTIAAGEFYAEEIISSDRLRKAYTGSELDQSENQKVFQALHKLVKTRLELGLRTCVDATNLHRKDRLAILALAPAGIKAAYYVVNRPMREKLLTAGWRSRFPGLIEKHEQRFNSCLKDIMSGDGMGVRVVDYRSK